MKVLAIVGARPQFIKHAPFVQACAGRLALVTLHTQQHYDTNMSAQFFAEFGMPEPDHMLPPPLATHDRFEQIAVWQEQIAIVIQREQPNWVFVYGDTNSTLAGARAAHQVGVPLAHAEAGLRSYLDTPEELNRVETDALSQLYFVNGLDSEIESLLAEGCTGRIVEVGDIMRDALQLALPLLPSQPPVTFQYYYATIHRADNTDTYERLNLVLQALNRLSLPCVLALHPRTRARMEQFSLHTADFQNIQFIDPQSYSSNLHYMHHAEGVLTDSGGMQKEAYWLKKKCISLRPETEWRATLAHKANQLAYTAEALASISRLLQAEPIWIPDLYGDGRTAERMVQIFLESE